MADDHRFVLLEVLQDRVDERAARITEQVRRTHGVIDDETLQTLLADDES